MTRTTAQRKAEPGETSAPTPSDLAGLYRQVWSHTTYRKFAPGERNIDAMLAALSPRRGASFIDFGCGTGRGAHELAQRGFAVMAVDFADNCLDRNVDVPFLIADLAALPELSAQFGYCTDVMEHVAPEHVDEVLAGIARCVRSGAFFSIATVMDNFGPRLVGKQLHLTVQDAAWWRIKLAEHWPFVEIIETNSIQIFAVARHDPQGFVENREGVVNTACNTAIDEILANVKANAHRPGVKWLRACEAHERHAVLVGGGPSLRHSLREIALRQNDPRVPQDVIAINGAAYFLLTQDITPDYQLIVDPRERNLTFLEGLPARAWLLAAQCHPALFDALDGQDVTTFLMHLDEIAERKNELLPKGTICTPIIGPITAGLTAMSVAFAAGYRSLHLYGYDSSDADEGAAHAYAQEQTGAEQKRLTVRHDGKAYTTSYAMFAQAEAFEDFARMLVENGAQITVHGTGLLPDIARQMANNQGD